MTDEKKKNLVISLTTVGVLFVTFLLGVIVYQFISIHVVKKRIQEYQEQIVYYQSVIEQSAYDLEYYRSEYYLEQMARAYGYIYPEDKNQ